MDEDSELEKSEEDGSEVGISEEEGTKEDSESAEPGREESGLELGSAAAQEQRARTLKADKERAKERFILECFDHLNRDHDSFREIAGFPRIHAIRNDRLEIFIKIR